MIRLHLSIDALVLITPGPHSCAVVVSSVPGYPLRLSDASAQFYRESAEDGPRLAYTVAQAARALGLSKSMIYDQLRANRLAFVKVGKRRAITRQQIDAWLAGLPTGPPSLELTPATDRGWPLLTNAPLYTPDATRNPS
jgi:excisionase family DNA binding protein